MSAQPYTLRQTSGEARAIVDSYAHRHKSVQGFANCDDEQWVGHACTTEFRIGPGVLSVDGFRSATPPAIDTGSLPIAGNEDVVVCRQTVRQLAAELRFSVTGQTMLVTAASELARNTLVHGGGGWFTWQVIRERTKRGIRLVFEDNGPGIPDLDLAMTDGWTSRKGMGLGLPGARRLVNEFDVQTTVGRGTRVIVTRWQLGP